MTHWADLEAAERNERLILVADVGGTNARLALAKNCAVLNGSIRQYQNRDLPEFAAAIHSYLDEMEHPRLGGACFAVAGPVINGQVQLTNVTWEMNENSISDELGRVRTVIINDLQAVGHALHLLKHQELQYVIKGSGYWLDNPRLVINAGTGFNAVAVHESENGRLVAPSECGHAGLPVIGIDTFQLRRFIESRFGYASIEDVLSGPGAARTKEWLSCHGGADEAKISAGYHRILASTLGAVARDLTLTHLPYGGVYLTGGLIRAIAPHLNTHGFATEFLEAGRFSDFMSRFSVRIICDDMAALRGCAAGFEYL